MLKVRNQPVIAAMSRKSLRANRARNIIAIIAIALTTVLFTSLFTIALSINHSIQQANFRQVGGYSHGGFKYLSEEQAAELSTDPLIKQYGLRRFIGMPGARPFNKAHVEVSAFDANMAQWMFIKPAQGRLPLEGTNEAATDTRVLSLLGVEPKLGAQFTLSFDVDGQQTTETFTLCGWWEYDKAVVASHVAVPWSRADEIFKRLGTQGLDGMTATWNMNVMFANSLNIEDNINTVLANHGYQSVERSRDNYIATGVNWGYSSSQLADSIDPAMVLALSAMLLLIVFTGYLIIYNVFQISVTGDIRFYGLLKTIGTTGKQLSGMIRRQALLLSLVGIPLGLAIGYGVGVKLTPVVLSRLNGVVADAVSASPLIFLGSALFALATVIISCRKPGRMAAKVSPVEAVRYTEGSGGRKQIRKARSGASLLKMAWANLGRSRSKTAVTVISLALAVVLLNQTVTFVGGFSMDKYLSNLVSDFTVGGAGYFQTGGEIWNAGMAVPQDVIDEIHAQGGVTGGGRVYGMTGAVLEFADKDYLRGFWSRWNDAATVERILAGKERQQDGRLAENAQLYGMERYTLDKLKVLEGDISKLADPEKRYIAAVYSDDDYGNAEMNSHWARLGDTVTLRYVEEFEYYDPDTGEILDPAQVTGDRPFRSRAVKYRDVDYEVAALVTVPHALSYRYYGADGFVLGDRTFIEDTGTNAVMQYSFDTTDESNADMEAFLADLTSSRLPDYDYESKATYAQEFESMRSMFLTLGGVLCFIIGLVGVLNFLNAVLTGMMTRRREFAVLQAVGMTGKQLKTMLVWEGLLYTMGAVLVSLLFSAAVGPFIGYALGNIFWFFSYHFTVIPVLSMAPVFIILGITMPLVVYGVIARRTIVERLRGVE